jgi:acylphosphatase
MAVNPAEPSRARITIAGRVQGVYFRASACQQAQSLGITGWVRNCSDGSVELLAEGTRDKLDQLIAWCHRGPTGARVSDVSVRWEEPEHGFHGFMIKR